MKQHIKAAIVQDAPLPLAIGAGIERTVVHVKEAVEAGANVIAFGEFFLGGYPSWLEHVPAPALWDHPGTKELHALLLRQAIRGADPRFEPLQWVVDIAGACVSIGGYERVRSSLFHTQFLFRPKAPPLLHRKLVPAAAERMLIALGDGSTMGVHEAGWGRVGQLAAAEHWMPLARAAMHHARESVHVAAWPSVDDVALLAASHYAYEGRAFVLAAGTLQRKDDLLHGYARAGGEGAGLDLLERLPEGRLQRGRSAIVAPDGVIVAEAGDAPTILAAALDLDEIDQGLATMDVDGLHARPDVFELRIDRRPRTGIADADEEGAEGESEAA